MVACRDICDASDSDRAGSKYWQLYHELMCQCRQRNFKDAYGRILEYSNKPAAPGNQGREQKQAEDISLHIVRGRIYYEFKKFHLASAQFWQASQALHEARRNDCSIGEPFGDAVDWLAASAIVSLIRIGRHRAKSHPDSEQVKNYLKSDHWAKVDSQNARRWLDIYRQKQGSGDDLRPTIKEATIDAPEVIFAWCRYLRRQARRHQFEPHYTETAHRYIDDAIKESLKFGGSPNEVVYDRVIGFAPAYDNLCLHKAILLNQSGEHCQAMEIYRHLLTIDSGKGCRGRCVADSVAGLVLASRRIGGSKAVLFPGGPRNNEVDKNPAAEDSRWQLRLIDDAVNRLLDESFVVDDNDNVKSIGRTSPGSNIQPSSDIHVELPDLGTESKRILLHRQICTMWRQKATEVSNTCPRDSVRMCESADKMLNQAGYFRGWKHATANHLPKVRSSTLARYHIRLGQGDQALCQIETIFRSQGLDCLAERLIKYCCPIPPAYSEEDFRTDWHLIRTALQEEQRPKKGDSQRLHRLVTAIVTAADVMRSFDRLKPALSWYDILSVKSEESLKKYLCLRGYIEPVEDVTPWLTDQGRQDPLEPDNGDKPEGGKQPKILFDRPIPPTLRYLPLARAVSVRYHIGEARLALDIAEHLFSLHDEDNPVKAEQINARLPDELSRELAIAKMNAYHYEDAEQWFAQLARSQWEVARISGVAGLIDIWRRRGRIEDIRRVTNDLSKIDELFPVEGEKVREFKCGRLKTDRCKKSSLPQLEELSLEAQRAIDISRAWAEVQIGDHEIARQLAHRAALRLPYDVSAWLGLSKSLRALGLHGRATELLKWLLEGGTQPHWVNLDESTELALKLRHEVALATELGWCYIEVDRQNTAKDWFRQAFDRGPYQRLAGRGLIQSLAHHSPKELEDASHEIESKLRDAGTRGNGRGHHISHDEVAADQYENLLKRDIALERGRACSVGLHFDEADACFTKAIDLTMSLPWPARRSAIRVLGTIIDALLDGDRVSKAEEFERQLEQLSKPGREFSEELLAGGRLLLTVRMLLATGQPTEAVETIEEHLNSEYQAWQENAEGMPENLRVAYILTLYEARKFERALSMLDEFDQAREEGRRRKTRNSASAEVWESDVRRLIRAWVSLALSELPEREDRYEQARTAWTLARTSDRESPSELHLRAVAEAQGVRLREQLSIQAGEDVDRDQLVMYWRRSEGPVEQKAQRQTRRPFGSVALAFDYLDQAIKRRPNDASLKRDRAALEMTLGSSRRAQLHLAKAKQLSNDDPRIALLESVAAYRAGNYDEAVQSSRRAVALDPLDYVHHRAHVLALIQIGDLAGALRAADYGAGVVSTKRSLYLRLLSVDVLIRRAGDEGARQRRSTVSQARRRLQAIARDPNARGHFADLVHEKRAELLQLGGNVRQAGRELDKVSLRGKSLPRHRDLRARIVAVTPMGSVAKPGLWLVLTVLLTIGLSIYWATAPVLQTKFDTMAFPEPSYPFFFAGPGLAALMLAFSLVGDRFVSIRTSGASVDLEPQLLDEIVHADLDLSASRLLLTSGIALYRPEVPYDDIEPRFLAPPM